MAMEAPLLDEESGKSSQSFVPLRKRQMGGKEVEEDAYAPEVAQLVSRLEDMGKEDVSKVRKFKGFKESAYRYVFAFEDKYQGKSPHLLTILPSGKVENDKHLEPAPESGLIAYTYTQAMTNETAARHFLEKQEPFVFLKDGKPHVMQTWPTKFNDKFKSEFDLVKYPDYPTNPDGNPDEVHYERVALEDFKKVVTTLFELPLDDPDLPLWLGVKITDNDMPVYEGTGSELMALLRLRKDIRDSLDILQILEPDGFVSRYRTPKGKTGEKDFHMDLAVPYCLYIKKGWETMACVKPVVQFNWEAERSDEEPLQHDSTDDDGVLSIPLEMEWVSGPAYIWARRANVVWVGAGVMLVFSAFLYKRASWWEQGVFTDWQQHFYNTLAMLVCVIAVMWGIYCDNEAMRFCLVPWLQNVPKAMKIPFVGPVDHKTFRYFALACTASQMLTIQLNAWVLGNSYANSGCSVTKAWQWIWEQSAFGYCPLSLIPCMLVLWALSALQGIVPIFYGMAEMPPAEETIPEKPHHDMHLDTGSFKTCYASVLPHTLREGVNLMALAAGMRYTGSKSLSYPAAMIERIRDGQLGFTTQVIQNGETRWEPAKHGWEYRCVKELEKLHSIQVKRVWFILLFKYALQMNVQVTLFIIKGTDKTVSFNWFAAGGELISLGAMMLGILTELYDMSMLCTMFWEIRESVLLCTGEWESTDEQGSEKEGKDKEKGKRKDDNDVYASHFFKKEETVKEETLTIRDLRKEYWRIWCNTITLVLVAAFALWLIGYEILKFINFWRCPEGLWQWHSGCLKADHLYAFVNQTCPAQS